MSQFINDDEAMKFLDDIQDPVVKNLVLRAYGTMVFELAPVEVQGQFDLLFFFKVMAKFLANRQEIAQALTGNGKIANGPPDAAAKVKQG